MSMTSYWGQRQNMLKCGTKAQRTQSVELTAQMVSGIAFNRMMDQPVARTIRDDIVQPDSVQYMPSNRDSTETGFESILVLLGEE